MSDLGSRVVRAQLVVARIHMLEGVDHQQVIYCPPVIPKSRHQLLKDWTRITGADIIARSQAT
jgi:hypothetical protein